MSSQSNNSVECFNDGFNCAQAVFASHCEDFNVNKELAFRIAGTFGGGMGHNGQTCGAVTGALMLLGLKYGKFKIDDVTSKDIAYNYVTNYINDFKNKHGTINCIELINYDLGIKEELIKARESGVFKTVCPMLVKDSVEIVEKYL